MRDVRSKISAGKKVFRLKQSDSLRNLPLPPPPLPSPPLPPHLSQALNDPEDDDEDVVGSGRDWDEKSGDGDDEASDAEHPLSTETTSQPTPDNL